MTAPRDPLPAKPAEHPLRASLRRGEQGVARSMPALQQMLRISDRRLLSDDVIARIQGLVASLTDQLSALHPGGQEADAITARLLGDARVRHHCLVLAHEWATATMLESSLAIDPVLSPLWQEMTAGEMGELAIAGLAAHARFAQAQRRMALPLEDLPADVLNAALLCARAEGQEGAGTGETRLRDTYRESDTRLALIDRLVAEYGARGGLGLLQLGDAGVALWFSALAQRSDQDRGRLVLSAVGPHFGRLLLSLRAAGLAPAEAERQVVMLHPDAALPRGLHDVGTREAAQWLAEVEG